MSSAGERLTRLIRNALFGVGAAILLWLNVFEHGGSDHANSRAGYIHPLFTDAGLRYLNSTEFASLFVFDGAFLGFVVCEAILAWSGMAEKRRPLRGLLVLAGTLLVVGWFLWDLVAHPEGAPPLLINFSH